MISPVALLFDVLGTTVNWFQPVSNAITDMAVNYHLDVDADAIALEWRQAYFDGMANTISGAAAWRKVDDIHRAALDELLPKYGMSMVDETSRQQLNQAWHYLDTWSDSLDGLHQIRQQRIVATLSNGNLDLLIHLNRHNGLQWDCLFCSDLFAHFKPDPETYLGACNYLKLEPEQVMMVACHRKDVEAARQHGLLTAFVSRPDEYGNRKPADKADDGEFDILANDFIDLARQLRERGDDQ